MNVVAHALCFVRDRLVQWARGLNRALAVPHSPEGDGLQANLDDTVLQPRDR